MLAVGEMDCEETTFTGCQESTLASPVVVLTGCQEIHFALTMGFQAVSRF